jgi:prevent-host-death family protein
MATNMQAPENLPQIPGNAGGPLKRMSMSPEQANRPHTDAIEVTMNDLDRRAARVVHGVVGGEVAVITKHGSPVAMIVPFADAPGLKPAEIGAVSLTRLRERFAARENRRWWSRILHGRWYNGHGTKGPYGQRR